jgi:GGDEF domain-containing protein
MRGALLVAHKHVFDVREIDVSVSLGAAVYPRDGLDAASLLMCADRAMYRQKQERRRAASLRP